MRLGPRCQLRRPTADLLLLLAIGEKACKAVGAGTELLLTHGTDGKHSAKSKHYGGNAVDCLAIRPDGTPLPDAEQQVVVDRWQARAGPDYDVIYEGAGTDNRHIHAEVDPEGPTRV